MSLLKFCDLRIQGQIIISREEITCCYLVNNKLVLATGCYYEIYIKTGTLPEMFDQHLLDHAAEMFGKWGKSTHMNEKEHLFESFGLASRTLDSNDLKMQKIALRCVCTRMMDANLNRKDASDLIRNLNKIKDPGYEWLE